MERIIGIIGGTGDQGFGLALRWAMAGEKVLIGSRQRLKAEEAVRRLKSILGDDVDAEGFENPDATEKANVIVLTVPFAAQIDIIKSIRDHLKQNDIFVDVTVPLASAIGGRGTRTLGVWQGSAGEQAAELVPKGVKVVSAFHNVVAEALQDISRPVDCDVIVCSDFPDAKAVVMELANEIAGIRAIDGGPLENARIVEQITALLISLNLKYKVTRAGIRITGLNLEKGNVTASTG